MALKTTISGDSPVDVQLHVRGAEDQQIQPNAILAGLCAGIGGVLAPGMSAYWWAGGRDLLEVLTVTSPIVFAVAIIVLALRAKFFRTPFALLCFSAAVLGISYALCEAAVHLGGVLFRWMVMGVATSDSSFKSLVAAHYSTHGAWFIGLALAIGLPVGVVWARLLQPNEPQDRRAL